MIGGLIAIAIAIWFYRTAVQMNDPRPVFWAVNGVAAYYIVVFLWWILVLKPASATLHHGGTMKLYALHVAGYALGLLLAWFVRRRWLASSAGESS